MDSGGPRNRMRRGAMGRPEGRVCRPTARLLRAVLLALALGLPSLARAQAVLESLALAPVVGEHATLEVLLPLGPQILPGDYVALTVQVTTTAPLRGHLEARLDRATVLRQRLDVGPGVFQYEWCVPAYQPVAAATGRELLLRVVPDGSSTATLQTPPVHCHLGAGFEPAGEDESAYSLATRPVVWVAGARFNAGSEVGEGLAVTSLRPGAVPTNPALLRGVRDVVLCDGALDDLRVDQVQCLLDWAWSGGRLLVAGDAVYRPTRVQPSLDLLGIALSSDRRQARLWTVPDDAIDLLYQDADGRIRRLADSFSRPAEEVPARVTPLALRGAPRPEGDGLPVVQSRPHGLGRLAVTPLLLAQREEFWNGRQGAAVLLHQALGLDGVLRGQPRIAPPPEQDWTHAAEADIGLPPISRRVMAAYLLLFALLATLGDRLLLSLLKRQHWTWVTTVLLAVAFAGAAEIISKLSRGFEHRGSSLTLQDYGFDGALEETRWQQVIPARRGAFSQPLAADLAQSWSAVNNEGGAWNLSTGALRLQAPVWRPACSVSSRMTRGQAPFAADLAWQGTALRGRLWLADDRVAAPRWLCVGYRGAVYRLDASADGRQWTLRPDPSALPGPNPDALPGPVPVADDAWAPLLRALVASHRQVLTPVPPRLPAGQSHRIQTLFDISSLDAINSGWFQSQAATSAVILAMLRPARLYLPRYEPDTAVLLAELPEPAADWSLDPVVARTRSRHVLRQLLPVDLLLPPPEPDRAPRLPGSAVPLTPTPAPESPPP